MAEEACVKKRKGREEKRCTSDSGLSSRMGQVTYESSLCLDLKKKGGGVSKVSHKKAKRYFKR